jgi:hypothetical protein
MKENLIYNNGRIDYEQLKRAADSVMGGLASIDRLSLAEECGREEGTRRTVEATLLCADVSRTGRTKESPVAGETRQNKTDDAAGQERALKRIDESIEQIKRGECVKYTPELEQQLFGNYV